MADFVPLVMVKGTRTVVVYNQEEYQHYRWQGYRVQGTYTPPPPTPTTPVTFADLANYAKIDPETKQVLDGNNQPVTGNGIDAEVDPTAPSVLKIGTQRVPLLGEDDDVQDPNLPARLALAALVELIQDTTAGMFVDGGGATWSYNDTTGKLSVSISGGGTTGSDPEGVRDTVFGALRGFSGVKITEDDLSDKIDITLENVPITAIEDLTATLVEKADLVNGVVPLDQLPPGTPGPYGFTPVIFGQGGEVQATANGAPYVLPHPCTIDEIVPAIAVAPTTVPIQIDVAIDGISAWSNPANRPSINPGQVVGAFAAPDNPGPYPKGTVITSRVVSADTQPSGGATTPTFQGPVATYSSGDQLVPGGTIPIPGTIAQGKFWYAWVVSGTRATGLPDGWTEVQYVKDTAPSLHGVLLRKTAGADEAAVPSVITLSASAPLTISSFCLSSTGIEEGLVPSFTDSALKDYTSPGLSTTGADRVGLWLFGQRLTSGAQGTVTLGGEAAPTEVADFCTTRPTTANYVNVVGTKTLATSEQGGTATATGSTPIGRWVAVVLAIGPNAASRSPGEDLSVQVTVQRVAEATPGGLDDSALSALIASKSMSVVNIGSDPDVQRPQSSSAVYWICDEGVTPSNALEGDLIYNEGSE